MKLLLFLAIFSKLLFTATLGISFRIQKGTYSGINLCKNDIPTHEKSARSSIECFTFCQILLGGKCLSFSYQTEMKTCFIYDDVIRFDFNAFANSSCIGYQLFDDCPDGFTYLIEGNKCLKLKPGNWNWSTARNQCNELHPQSHLIIVNDYKDLQAFSFYFEFGILQKCRNQLYPFLFTSWTSGISFYNSSKRQPFQWNPFPDVIGRFKPTAPWWPGEPNSAADGSNYCVLFMHKKGLDDNYCSLRICAACEIDSKV